MKNILIRTINAPSVINVGSKLTMLHNNNICNTHCMYVCMYVHNYVCSYPSDDILVIDTAKTHKTWTYLTEMYQKEIFWLLPISNIYINFNLCM